MKDQIRYEFSKQSTSVGSYFHLLRVSARLTCSGQVDNKQSAGDSKATWSDHEAVGGPARYLLKCMRASKVARSHSRRAEQDAEKPRRDVVHRRGAIYSRVPLNSGSVACF